MRWWWICCQPGWNWKTRIWQTVAQADIQHVEFRDDRFVAAVAVNSGQPVTLVYLARAVTPGTYQVPMPMVESMYVPQWRATGVAGDILIVKP